MGLRLRASSPEPEPSPEPRAPSLSDNRAVAEPAGEMVEEVYAELRRMADRYVRRERAQSVQATELVHEAYLRLAKEKNPRWQNRTHFMAIAAISMRRLLVERARARGASKRGGGQRAGHARRDAASPARATDRWWTSSRSIARWTGLAEIDAQQARIVELRFFGGLSVEETAEALAISPATVKRHWTIARAWLLRELETA